MNATALLIGLGPLLGWGLFPTIASKIGGRPVNQILGTSLGTLIFAAIFSMINGLAFPTGMDLFFSILSGVGWACAQIITFKCFTMIGSSRAMPVTTAFQLLGASLWGVFFLGNWPGATAKLLGAFALVLIMIGAKMTVWSETESAESAGIMKKAVLLLAVGEIGYWAYSAAPQATAIDGMHAFLPQAIGMVIVAVIYSAVVTIKGGETSPFIEAVSYKQIFSGFFFAYERLGNWLYSIPNISCACNVDRYLVLRSKENSQGNDRNDYRLSFDFGSSYDHSDDLKKYSTTYYSGR